MTCLPKGSLSERLGDARYAFVGTAGEVSNDSYAATVRVESIWLGDRLPEVVNVDGHHDSDPRSFDEGERYLFVPLTRDEGQQIVFRDSACSATTGYTSSVARLTPDGAIEPQSGGPSAWVLVLVVLLAVGFWQARRARERAAEVEV